MDSTRRSFLRRAGLLVASIPFIRGLGSSQSDVKNPHGSDILMDLTGKPKGRGTLTVVTGPHFAGKTTVLLHHTATVFFCEANPPSVNVSLPSSASGLFIKMACALKGLDPNQFDKGIASSESWQAVSTTLQTFAASRRNTSAQMFFQTIFTRPDEQIETVVKEFGVGLIVVQSANLRLVKDKSDFVRIFGQLKEIATRHDIAILTEYTSHTEMRHDKFAWDEEVASGLADLGCVDSVILVCRSGGSNAPQWHHCRNV